MRTVGSGGPSPARSRPGRLHSGGSQVVLYLGEEKPTDQVEVPNVQGKTPAAPSEPPVDAGPTSRPGVADYTENTRAAGGPSPPAPWWRGHRCGGAVYRQHGQHGRCRLLSAPPLPRKRARFAHHMRLPR